MNATFASYLQLEQIKIVKLHPETYVCLLCTSILLLIIIFNIEQYVFTVIKLTDSPMSTMVGNLELLKCLISIWLEVYYFLMAKIHFFMFEWRKEWGCSMKTLELFKSIYIYSTVKGSSLPEWAGPEAFVSLATEKHNYLFFLNFAHVCDDFKVWFIQTAHVFVSVCMYTVHAKRSPSLVNMLVTTWGLSCSIYIFEWTWSLSASYSTNFFLYIWFQYFSSVPVAPHTN